MKISYLDNDGNPQTVDAPAAALLAIIREFKKDWRRYGGHPEKINVKEFLLSLDFHMDFKIPYGFQVHPHQQEMFNLAELEVTLRGEVRQSKGAPRRLAAQGGAR